MKTFGNEMRGPARERVATIPNALSLVRLASVPVFVALFVTGHEEAGVIVYAAAAWTDFFDGYIARRTGSVTELGKILDPLADRVFIVALAIALVARDTLPLWLAAVVIARDLAVVSLFPILDRRGMVRIPVSFTGKSATASLLFGLTWLAWSRTSFPLNDIGDEVGMIFTLIGAALYWVAGGLYAREAIRRLATAGRETNR
jgi:cardiolipin synthase